MAEVRSWVEYKRRIKEAMRFATTLDRIISDAVAYELDQRKNKIGFSGANTIMKGIMNMAQTTIDNLQTSVGFMEVNPDVWPVQISPAWINNVTGATTALPGGGGNLVGIDYGEVYFDIRNSGGFGYITSTHNCFGTGGSGEHLIPGDVIEITEAEDDLNNGIYVVAAAGVAQTQLKLASQFAVPNLADTTMIITLVGR